VIAENEQGRSEHAGESIDRYIRRRLSRREWLSSHCRLERGRNIRVETRVAIEFAVSCSPLRKLKARELAGHRKPNKGRAGLDSSILKLTKIESDFPSKNSTPKLYSRMTEPFGGTAPST
jgi:hypothetical protein